MIFYWVVYILYDVFFFVLTYLYTPVNVFEVQVSLRSSGNMQRSLNKQESLRSTLTVRYSVKILFCEG